MKSLLVTALGALALSLVLTSIATAQDAAPEGRAGQTANASSQLSALPVAEAKKRYQQAQERLRNIVKSGGRESADVSGKVDRVIEMKGIHDHLRAAVVQDFDARRQLQQSELADLENRVARIKRALEIRDAMRDTIIDQRTDELRDVMEEAGKGGARDKGAAAHAGGRNSISPPKPTLPPLALNVPTLVPGLEEVGPAYGPALTHDLTVLVFAGAGEKRGDYDLFIAERADAASPFSPPERIDACSSARYETFPTLSPDGLELLFLRFESRPKLYYARRDSLQERFGRPALWAVSDALPAGRNSGAAQFIDERHVQFVTHGNRESQERQPLVASRAAPQRSFGSPVPLDLPPAPVPQFVTSDRLRSYFGLPSGLLMAARQSEAEPFGPPITISDIPIDGPVWVAPKESLIFFCSPGLGGQIESSRKLWMLRVSSKGGAAASRAESDADATKREARRLQLDVDEAKAKLDSAESSYKRVEKMRASAAIEQALLDEQAEELKLARIELERAKATLDPADGEAAAAEKNRRLAELDVDAAKAKLAKEGIRYERYKRLHADNAILGQVVDDQAVKWQRARFELERAMERLVIAPSPAGDGAVDEPTKPSSEKATVDESHNDEPEAKREDTARNR